MNKELNIELIGYVNADSIVNQCKNYNIGDKVILKQNATFYDGKSIENWIFNKALYIAEICGDKICLAYKWRKVVRI